MTVLGMVILGGCVAVPPTPAEFEQKSLAYLQDGKSTREDLLLRLGEPSGQFESQRILTYRMYSDSNGKSGVVRKESFPADPQRPNWEGTLFNLVLVFDGSTLARHSVVPIK